MQTRFTYEELEALSYSLVSTCEKVGAFIGESGENLQTSQVHLKGFSDLVTEIDIAAERLLVDELQQLLPAASFITEEKTIETAESQLNWVIDPIDGTTNFVHGIPFFCISVALMQNGLPIIGLVYEVSRKECFYTWRGAPTFLGGTDPRTAKTELKVSNHQQLKNCIFATGFPYGYRDFMEDQLNLIRELVTETHGLRRLGSAALDLAYVAAGRLDGYFEFGLNIWDIAAGWLLVENAGGTITDLYGSNKIIDGSSLVATNGKVHEAFFEICHKHVKPDRIQ